jgi:hypothetical protein
MLIMKAPPQFLNESSNVFYCIKASWNSYNDEILFVRWENEDAEVPGNCSRMLPFVLHDPFDQRVHRPLGIRKELPQWLLGLREFVI